ncbi:MAG: AAA family ATPase [Janthinobacterium lividum]
MTMYLPFFRLAQAPFTIAPDPRYLFMSERHREALAHLLYGVGSGGGIVLLTGEIGAGKTTVCRCFLEQIPADCKVAYIFNPRLTVLELLQTICAEFGIAIGAENGDANQLPTLNHYFNALNAHLLASHAAGGKNVLIIDEAQNLTADVLEQLRQSKLLQIILIGQPELRAMVARPELEQLAQRIIARFHLGPLSREETALYIKHRLAVAGGGGANPFSAATMRLIHRLCAGVPRRINLLCDRALLGAYTQGRHQVSAQVVRRAAREVFGAAEEGRQPRPGHWWRAAAIGAVGGAGALVVLLVLAYDMQSSGRLAGIFPNRLAAAAPNEPGPNTALVSSTRLGQAKGAATAGRSASASFAAAAPGAATPLPQAAGTTPATASATAGTQAAATLPAASSTVVAGAEAASAVNAQPPLAADNWLKREPVQATSALLPALATYWGATLAAGEPCTAAQIAGLHCYAGRGGLAELRQLNRPAVLGLRDAQRQVRPVLLLELAASQATLRIDGQPQSISLAALEKVFSGEFATFWRAPQGFRERLKVGDQGADVEWLARQLAGAASLGSSAGLPAAQAPARVFDEALSLQLRQYQQARGLLADGIAGPRTLMSLNQVAGIREPQLRAAASTTAVREN